MLDTTTPELERAHPLRAPRLVPDDIELAFFCDGGAPVVCDDVDLRAETASECTYAAGDPINLRDPWGLSAETEDAGPQEAGGLAGAVEDVVKAAGSPLGPTSYEEAKKAGERLPPDPEVEERAQKFWAGVAAAAESTGKALLGFLEGSVALAEQAGPVGQSLAMLNAGEKALDQLEATASFAKDVYQSGAYSATETRVVAAVERFKVGFNETIRSERAIGRLVPGLAVGAGAAVAARGLAALGSGSNELLLFRSMKALRGHPEIGPSARMLGVRGGIDIPVERGLVRPGTGGMSVAPETPINLPRHRRPPGLGGSGKDPVWCIGQSCLGPSLRFRRDSPTHGVVEPSRVMTIGEYEAALAETLGGWGLVP